MFVARLVNATCSYAFSVVAKRITRSSASWNTSRSVAGPVAEDARQRSASSTGRERGRAEVEAAPPAGLALGRRDERRDAASVAGARTARAGDI